MWQFGSPAHMVSGFSPWLGCTSYICSSVPSRLCCSMTLHSRRRVLGWQIGLTSCTWRHPAEESPPAASGLHEEERAQLLGKETQAGAAAAQDKVLCVLNSGAWASLVSTEITVFQNYLILLVDKLSIKQVIAPGLKLNNPVTGSLLFAGQRGATGLAIEAPHCPL